MPDDDDDEMAEALATLAALVAELEAMARERRPEDTADDDWPEVPDAPSEDDDAPADAPPPAPPRRAAGSLR